jgi:hypothetical protein
VQAGDHCTKPDEVLWALGGLALLLQWTYPTKGALKDEKFYGPQQQAGACSPDPERRQRERVIYSGWATSLL